MSTVSLAGTLSGSNILLTSSPVSGQVVTFTGSISDTSFTGTYTISGGCADGDQGSITGSKVASISGTLNGTFTPAVGEGFQAVVQVSQNNATTAGTFGLTGTVAFSSSCLSSGTIKSGTFPAGSFVLGTSVALEIGTDNGTIVFEGTIDQVSGEITGEYKVFGGTCDSTGTAVLAASDPWGY
jgi:hypothetical protein